MTATNRSSMQIANCKFAVSAAKYVTADLGAASGLNLAPHGQNDIRQVSSMLLQSVISVNSLQGQKAVLLRLRVKYELNGSLIEQTVTINQIPVDF